ncbi:MAG TPA: hypothetical protein VD963_07455 [Phycisphaerales bacterium]|nr:hypothetical protein [Phycisphaerales bacterium]
MSRALHLQSRRAATLIALAACAPPACSSPAARENVLAHTETMLGLSITENPATRSYQGRLGYGRHELFHVPTSKLVAGGEHVTSGAPVGPAPVTFNDPASVPDVLAEIQVGGTLRGSSQKVRLYQRLAVGSNAVRSPAASLMMAPDDVSASRARRDLDDPVRAATREALRPRLAALVERSQGLEFAPAGAAPGASDSPWLTWSQAADTWSAALGASSYAELWQQADADRLAQFCARWERALTSESRPLTTRTPPHP